MSSEEVARLSCRSSEGPSFEVRLRMPAGDPCEKPWLLDCQSWRFDAGHERWQKSFNAVDAQRLLRQLREARVTAIPPFICGLDGAIYELSLIQGFNAVTYSWWPGVPKGYEPLVEFGNALLQAGGLAEACGGGGGLAAEWQGRRQVTLTGKHD